MGAALRECNTEYALTEPGYQFIQFHNAFNRNVKVTFGALASLSGSSAITTESATISLPTGDEPWGQETRWRTLEQPVKDAAGFLAEIGIARAAAAYEDYLICAKGEFDRAELRPMGAKQSGTAAMDGFDAVLGVDLTLHEDLRLMADFFKVARNCVVHRSNRASEKLADLRVGIQENGTLDRWPRRIGKWKVSLPAIQKGELVDWRPRHSIMGSDVFYRCTTLLDRKLVEMMGAKGLARMAAHWCFFADPTVSCPAKLDAGTMVRTQLTGRYLVRNIGISETIALLKDCGQWDKIRAEFNRLYPDGPETALAIKRRARKK